MNIGKTLFGVMLTFAAGVIVGVLYAPAKGIVTRRRILRKGSEVAEDVMDKAAEVSNVIRTEFDSVSDEAEDLLKNGKKKALSILRTKLF